MKVVHLNGAGWAGGASIATRRIHESLTAIGVSSEIWVNSTKTFDPSIKSLSSRGARIRGAVSRELSGALLRMLATENRVLHSLSILGSGLVTALNQSDADVVHLHWTQGEMLSIRDVVKISKPIVWSLHDMWPFCGAEHLSNDARWHEGYLRSNRPDGESGLDLNRWTWERKKRNWTKPIQLVSPSDWLASCAKKSVLFRDWPIEVVPHPLNTSNWQPFDKRMARRIMGLPEDVPVLLSTLYPTASEYWKGKDLLMDVLRQFAVRSPEAQLVLLGDTDTMVENPFSTKAKHLGALADAVSLNLAYSAADAFLLTSRQESFSMSAQEALASGTPVIAFDNSGPTSFIEHMRLGYLARAFEVEDFVEGMRWATSPKGRVGGAKSHDYVASKFSPTLIASKYAEIYRRVL